MLPPSLNVEYIVYRIFHIFSSLPIAQGGFPGFIVFLIETVAIIGMVITFVLLVMVVYVRVRLIQTEHHGFQAREEAERLRQKGEEVVAKNVRWEMVVGLASSPNESDWRRAILEADIMLDSMLTDKGYVGETLGEKLKSASPQQFLTLQNAWEAHRLRNAIAHLGEAYPLTERDMKAAIGNYQSVFEEFDYI